MAGKPDLEYVKARRVLLDALVCLAPHADALVLVGAQAVYLHKIADRENQPDRLGDKDALDILRLLRGIGTAALAGSMRRLLEHELSRQVSGEALVLLHRLLAVPGANGVEMVVRATEGLEDPRRSEARVWRSLPACWRRSAGPVRQPDLSMFV